MKIPPFLLPTLTLALLLVSFGFTPNIHAGEETMDHQSYQPSWESLTQHETPEWFLDAKFGIYFHWGVYSYMGKGEWYSRQMYEDKDEGWNHWLREHHLETYGRDVHYHHFIPKYTAEHFDAQDWAELFKASGAQFVGPVAEHCDNFSNWDSDVNPFNTVNYGPKRDIVGELEKAIKAEDLKFVATFHHSWEWGWYNRWSGFIDVPENERNEFDAFYGEGTKPETFDSFRGGHEASGQYKGEVDPRYAPSRKFVDTWKAKIYEVVDRYEPDMLWFDSRLFVIPEADRQEMVAHYYNKGLEWDKDVVLTYKNEDLAKGAGVIDLEKGRFDEKTEFPWLTDDSFAWHGWSWRSDLNLKTPAVILQELVDIVSKNGCLLLNITPTHDGKIPQEQRDGLLEIGKWLKTNGEAVYGTRPFVTYGEGVTELKKNHFGGVQGFGVHYSDLDFRFTQNDKVLYITQLLPPKAGSEYLLKSFAAEGGKAATLKISDLRILGSDVKVDWSMTAEGLKLKSDFQSSGNLPVVYRASMY